MRFGFRGGLVGASLATVVVSVMAGAVAGAQPPANGANTTAGRTFAPAGGLVSPFPGLSVFASPALLVRDHESAFGSFSGESPQALTVDQASGDVYVVDTPEKRVLRFSANGAPDDFTAGPDAGTNALTGLSFQSSPSLDEVAVDSSGGPSNGNIYVTNSGSGQVSVFASSGEPLGTVTGSGTPSGSLGEDCGVAVDQANGDLYVADRANRVWRYSPSGTVVSETDYSGGIETPVESCQIAVASGSLYAKAWQEFPVVGAGPLDKYATSAFAVGAPPSASGTQIVARASAVATDPMSGDVYADERNKITVYDPSGTTLYSYGSGEIGGFSAGVAVASGGGSYVSDENSHEVHVYGPTLEPGSRADLGAFGSFTGEGPQAMSVDQTTGDVYVVDPAGKRLWRYSSGGAPVDFTAGPDAGTNVLNGLEFQFSPSLDEVAIDDSNGPAKGNVYVTQSGAGQVKVFSATGEQLGILTGANTPSGGLGEACGVAVDQANGDLYVADRANRVWRYSPSGAVVSETDYSGGIETPVESCQIAVASGSLYAKAWQEFPVVGAGPLDEYATSAFALGSPPSASSTQIAARATAVSTDPSSGDVYADEGSKVTVYGPSGAALYSFGSGEIGNFSAGVAIKAGGGDAYVADETNHQVRVFGPFSAPPPLLEAKPATGVGHVKATMNAHLDPNDSLPITSCAFEWGTDTNYTETPIACEQGNTYTTPADVSARLTGLAPGSTYHYRLHVTTSNGNYESEDETFETIPASSTPEAKTGEGSIASSTSTQMNGTVDPNANALTGCRFEYVTELAYESTEFNDLSSGGSVPCDQAPGSIPADYEDHEVTATATGLDSNQIYRYRLVAENNNGAGNGEATLLPGPPIVETTGSPTRTTNTARFDSRVVPHGGNAHYWFEYVTDAQFEANGFSEAASTPHQPVVVNEVQKLETFSAEIAPEKYGGNFTLSLGGYTTPELAIETPAADVQAALEALPSIGVGNVHVDLNFNYSSSVDYIVTFQGALADRNVEEIVGGYGAIHPVSIIRPETQRQGGLRDRSTLVSAAVQELHADTTYRYRVVADDGTPGGPSYGADREITTRASEAPLTHGSFAGPPDSDRAWEQVSIPNTNGNAVTAWGVSSNGDRAIYAIDGGSPGSTYGGETLKNSNNQLAERTASGWQRRDLYPTRDQAPGNIWEGPWGSSELTEMYAANYDETNTGVSGVFRMTPGAPAQLLFSRSQDIENNFFGSEDGSRLVGLMNGTVDPNYPLATNEEELYDFSSGSPKLIGLLPDNSVPSCGVSYIFMKNGGQTIPEQHWITPDGSHVFFNSFPGSNCNGQGNLYDRDLLTAKTTQIAPQARFIRYTAGAVFFVTEESLIPSDGGGNDIYRYQVNDGDISCITCATPATGGVETDVNQHNDYYAVAVSNDGSRVYFKDKRGALPGAAVPGIYRINVENDELAYVAPALYGDVSADVNRGNAISPDGTIFVFASYNPELNADNGQQDAGSRQYYLYNDRDRSLVCASCPPDGSAPRGEVIPVLNYPGINSNSVTNSGDFVFLTPTPLVRADQNTAAPGRNAFPGDDIYEWRDGRLLLVTDGITKSKIAGLPEVAGVGADGRDVFFTQAAKLTPDAIDSSRHLYDARIGGGFDFPPARVPCSLEACQGTPLPPPNDATPATLSFSGPGNPVVRPPSKACVGAKCTKKKKVQVHKRCAKGKVRKRGKCVKKVQRKRAKKANRNKGGAK